MKSFYKISKWQYVIVSAFIQFKNGCFTIVSGFSNWIRPYTQKIMAFSTPYLKRWMAWYAPYQTRAHARWAHLSLKEKQAIMASASFIGLLVFYFGLWSPMTSSIDELRTKMTKEKNTVAWLQSIDKKLKRYENNPATHYANTANLNTLQENIKNSTVSPHLSQLEQINAEEIHCHFLAINFDTLMSWLIDFHQKENVLIKSAEIKRINDTGNVQADFIFSL